MDDLHVRAVTADEQERLVSCLLCGELFEAGSEAAVLYDGDEPMGELCPACLRSGPREAALRAREYAAQLHAMAEGYLGLAEQVESLDGWMNRRGEAPGRLSSVETEKHPPPNDPRRYKPV
ncbi:MAG: hypothetical protein WBS54_16575 [Acidobacteriota bacterium]